MKKIIAAFIVSLSMGYLAVHAAPTSYVQVNPTAQQSGGFNVNTGTITNATLTNAHIVNATIDNGGGTGGLTSDAHGSTYGGTSAGSGVTSAGNVAIGSGAMGNASGTFIQQQTAYGFGALSHGGVGQTGDPGANTGLGYEALTNTVGGWQNVCAGWYCMGDNTDGYENAALGYGVMGGAQHFNHSVALGAYALGGNSSGFGNGNVAIGHSAASLTGESLGLGETPFLTASVMVGTLARARSPFNVDSFSVSNVLGLGYDVTTWCDNCAVIGRTDKPMRVGIGTVLSSATTRGTFTINSGPNMTTSAGNNPHPYFSGYGLAISTDDVVSQYDLAVDTGGVTLPRLFMLQSKTSAQIKALTPTPELHGQATGEEYYCSDCSTVAVCISTGSAAGAWALITNKTSVCN